MVNKAEHIISFEIALEIERAAMMCGSVKRIAKSNGWALPSDWKIQVKSAKTGAQPMAECTYNK